MPFPSAPFEPAASRAGAPVRRTLVWDAPVRLFHWLLVLCFALAWLTAESDRWQLLHVTAGLTVAGLVGFRLVWGLVGTRHARWRAFVRGPRAVVAEADALLQGHPPRRAGHNPLGAVAIVGLLALAALTTASGWAAHTGRAGHWMEEVHEALASGMLGLALLHVAGVAVGSWLQRENLARAMLDGRKDVPPAQGIRRAWRPVAALLLAAVLGFWWLQWQAAPQGGLVPAAQAQGVSTHGHDDD